jgi:hypothetical protein
LFQYTSIGGEDQLKRNPGNSHFDRSASLKIKVYAKKRQNNRTKWELHLPASILRIAEEIRWNLVLKPLFD